MTRCQSGLAAGGRGVRLAALLVAAGLGLLGGVSMGHAAPPKPAHDLWLEGESCQDHDFTVIGRDPAFQPCYGQAILQLQTGREAPADGYHATFRPALPEAGWWEVSLAVTKTGVAHLSPFTVEVQGYRPRRVFDLPVTAEYGPGGIFGWLRFGCFELPAGDVAVTVRCSERRPSDNDYLVYIDALALRRVPKPEVDARWIAGPAGAAAWRLEREFTLPAGAWRPQLRLACDGAVEVLVNGEAVGAGAGVEPALVVPLADRLRAGPNRVALAVRPASAQAGVLAWFTAMGERGQQQAWLVTDAGWQAVSGDGAAGPVRVLGDALAAPWGDLTVQPRPRLPAGRLPIPVKTGNLSVDLIMAAARGQPLPAPRPSPELDAYRDVAGISSVEDYICWLPLEPQRDAPDWAFYERNCRELEARGMGYTVYPWLHFAPEWARRSEFWEPLLCLDHGEATFAPSIWSPATLRLFDRFYGQLREHFGTRVRGVYVSMVCDYGEVGYPIGMADWVVPAPHKHAGYWCGDQHARRDFRTRLLATYGSLAALNQAWGTDFAAPEAVTYPPWTATEGPPAELLAGLGVPERAQARRRWLDFVDWYLSAMVDFAGQAVAASRRHFPDVPHEVKIGFGDERVMYGADYTAFVARSARDGYTVRSTHGKLPPYFYRRFSSAARHYGVPLVTEPPSDVSRDEEVERIFKDATSGTSEYFDYPANLLAASDLLARYGRYMEGEHSLTDVAFLFPTTDHRLRAGQHVPARLAAACAAATDLFDWGVLDERLVRDGALDRTRLLLLVEGSVCETDVLDRLRAWVEAGGILLAAAGDPLETVEGDRAWEERLFGPAGKQPLAADLCELRGTPLAAGRIDLGREGDAELLTGDWNGPESGHWEWGGEPDGVRKRWSGGRCGIRFCVDPKAEYEVALTVARHPRRLESRCEVRINGRAVGSVATTRTSVLQVRAGPELWQGQVVARLEIDAEPWRPSVVDGSTDTRTLGVAVRSLSWWPAATPEPAQAPRPGVRTEINLAAVQAACVHRLGQGAAVRTPFGPDQVAAYLELATRVVHEPGLIVPGRPAGVGLDGLRDGLWCALLPRRVLIHNTTGEERQREVVLSAAALRRAGAAAPAADLRVQVAVPPHGLASIELPEGRVLVP